MKRISLVVLVVALFAVSFGVVNAQGGQRGDQGGRDFDNRGMPDRPRGEARMELIQAVADELGITTDEIVAAAREGQTLALIIEANGGDVEAITANIVQLVTGQINERVTEGMITQERADAMLAQVEERVSEMMDNVPGQRGDKSGRIRDGLHNLVDSVSEATGLTGEELRAELQTGKTFNDILTENGVDIEAFTAQLIADAETHLAELVAEGVLTQEDADERLSTLSEKLPGFLNGELTRPVPGASNSV